ncbi:MAG: BrnA antitoxin family protein [Steroidobacteraceae bacterium]
MRRGRPPAEVRKVSTKLRLSPEVIEHFRAGGPGWQTRIDQALKRVVARASGGATIRR